MLIVLLRCDLSVGVFRERGGASHRPHDSVYCSCRVDSVSLHENGEVFRSGFIAVILIPIPLYDSSTTCASGPAIAEPSALKNGALSVSIRPLPNGDSSALVA